MDKKQKIEVKPLETVEPIGKRVLIRKDEEPLHQYDKVLFNPKGAIPVDFEGDNRLFVVEVENVVAVFRKA